MMARSSDLVCAGHIGCRKQFAITQPINPLSPKFWGHGRMLPCWPPYWFGWVFTLADTLAGLRPMMFFLFLFFSGESTNQVQATPIVGDGTESNPQHPCIMHVEKASIDNSRQTTDDRLEIRWNNVKALASKTTKTGKLDKVNETQATGHLKWTKKSRVSVTNL